MTNARQLEESVHPPPPPARSPSRPPLPRILDDEWEAPPSNRSRVRVVAVCIGMVLIVSCVAFLRSRVRTLEPDDERAWVPIAPAPSGLAQDTGGELRAESVRPPRLSRDDLWEPNEILVPPPARRRPALAAGYLSINSTPWAKLWVDGHVVGNTPQVRIRVTSGRHLLVLARNGFQTHSAWVTVPAGGTVRLTDITLAAVAQ